MTTIDEARAELTEAASAPEAAWCLVPANDLRTLLSSYDEMKGRIEEAVRLMGPAIVAGTIRSPLGTRKALTGWAVDLASFVSREKVDGGARG